MQEENSNKPEAAEKNMEFLSDEPDLLWNKHLKNWREAELQLQKKVRSLNYGAMKNTKPFKSLLSKSRKRAALPVLDAFMEVSHRRRKESFRRIHSAQEEADVSLLKNAEARLQPLVQDVTTPAWIRLWAAMVLRRIINRFRRARPYLADDTDDKHRLTGIVQSLLLQTMLLGLVLFALAMAGWGSFIVGILTLATLGLLYYAKPGLLIYCRTVWPTSLTIPIIACLMQLPHVWQNTIESWNFVLPICAVVWLASGMTALNHLSRIYGRPKATQRIVALLILETPLWILLGVMFWIVFSHIVIPIAFGSKNFSLVNVIFFALLASIIGHVWTFCTIVNHLVKDG